MNLFKKPDDVHILEAKKMADAIFRREPSKHVEMYEAIAERLALLYEEGMTNFINPKKPDAKD